MDEVDRQGPLGKNTMAEIEYLKHQLLVVRGPEGAKAHMREEAVTPNDGPAVVFRY